MFVVGAVIAFMMAFILAVPLVIVSALVVSTMMMATIFSAALVFSILHGLLRSAYPAL